MTDQHYSKRRPTENSRLKYRLWLRDQMNPYFFIAMRDEPEALRILCRELGVLRQNRRLLLADRDDVYIVAMKNRPGSLYETLRRITDRSVSYAMFAHSSGLLPGLSQTLEIQRFEFKRLSDAEIFSALQTAEVPQSIRRKIRREMARRCPEFDLRDFDRILTLLWLNNESYVRISPPARIAQTLYLFQKVNKSGGLFLDVEPMDQKGESRVLFSVANPPQQDFLLQVMEVFNRLDLAVNRAYVLVVSNGVHPYFLGSFYVSPRSGDLLTRQSTIFTQLQKELYTTQILSMKTLNYHDGVINGVLPGDDAALVNAFSAFCHAMLAHSHPEQFAIDDVHDAFTANQAMAMLLVRLFRIRFDPESAERIQSFSQFLEKTRHSVAEYNTGHRRLDEFRRIVFNCCLAFIRHTLKTNFFVLGKQALAFRLDPAYLDELGPSATAGLPSSRPFRVTFFFSRYGYGFHIGFSDIARGGWRTVIARSRDDFTTNASSIFRETYILAHTQHLKNKDIYEGGSKMVTILDASDIRHGEQEHELWNLYKLQYGIINAFLDIFVSSQGVAGNSSIIDYYGQDEPIELGPDENLHSSMVEAIARLSVQRGYILGSGLISSKRAGINHKEYGVTSTGVIRFAEITLAEIGINTAVDIFRVKVTGGPGGDVAGNSLRILMDHAPYARIVLVLDGTAALYDPEGAERSELQRLLLKEDLDRFSPSALHHGGFMVFKSSSRRNGLREEYRKVTCTSSGLCEEWISVDEFSKIYEDLPFTVEADLFIPAGGRPETIDATTWHRFILPDGTPSAHVIVEGANSFITPEARYELQRRNILIMRDASANKCGVIASSYETIASLILSESEFMSVKIEYVRDVISILETAADREARLILKRHRSNPEQTCTVISDEISKEINDLYSRLFEYFTNRPDLCNQTRYRRIIINHLPRLIREHAHLRRRINRLPLKYRYAILAAEIAASMVYLREPGADFEDALQLHLNRYLTARSMPR